MSVGTGGGIYWRPASFGANQEVYVTLTTINQSSSEIDLLLKSQSNSGLGNGVIEVRYIPASQRIQVWTYTPAQGWAQRGADITVTLARGNQFGTRVTAAGQVLVYRNGSLLATRDVTTWPYYAGTGYVGLWCVNATNTVLDNFGGGNW